jgi:hypothetical protein
MPGAGLKAAKRRASVRRIYFALYEATSRSASFFTTSMRRISEWLRKDVVWEYPNYPLVLHERDAEICQFDSSRSLVL